MQDKTMKKTLSIKLLRIIKKNLEEKDYLMGISLIFLTMYPFPVYNFINSFIHKGKVEFLTIF